MQPPPAKARWGCAAATLGRRLYVAGGCTDKPPNVLRSVECFDPDLNRWTLVKPMQWSRWGQFLVANSGKLYAIGGSSTRPHASVEEYDPNTNEWQDSPGLRSGCRWGAACASDNEHKLIVLGGFDKGGEMLDGVEIIRTNQRRGRWEPGPPLSSPRAGHAAIFHDGFVYCVGGRGASGSALTTVERMDVSGPSDIWEWEPVISMPTSTVSHAVASCGSDLMVAGGLNESGYHSDTMLFDATRMQWTQASSLQHARSGCAAAALGPNVWLLCGGSNGASNRTEIYEVVRKKWKHLREPATIAPRLKRFQVEGPRADAAQVDLIPRRARRDGPGRAGLGKLKGSGQHAAKVQLNRDGQAYGMSHEQQDHDYLELHDKQQMQLLFATHGDSQVLFSDDVRKMNKRGAIQERKLCITETTVYNLDTQYSIKWSQPLATLCLAVTVETRGGESGVILVFDKSIGSADETSKGTLKKVKSKTTKTTFAHLTFSCSSDERRKAVLEIISAHGSSRTDTILSCSSHDDVIPLMQAYPALAGSPLVPWYEEHESYADELPEEEVNYAAGGAVKLIDGSREAAVAAMARTQMMSYQKILTRQRKSWRGFFASYEKDLRQGSEGTGAAADSTALGRSLLQAVPKELVRKGLPPEQRAQMWAVMCGATEKMERNPAYYAKLAASAETLWRSKSSAGGARTSGQIERDVERTLPDHPRIASETGRAALRRILLAYMARKPDLVYTQSMASLAGLLLLVMEEEQTFWTLVVIIEEYLDESMYDATMSGLLVEQEVLISLAEDKLKDLKTHLDLLMPNGFRQCLQAVVPVWLVCLFVNCLPTETVLRIVDCFLLEGSKILFRMCLTLLKRFEAPLRATTSFEEALLLLQDSLEKDDKVFECDKLLLAAFDKKSPVARGLSMGQIHKIRQEVRDKLADPLQAPATLAAAGGGESTEGAGGFRAKVSHQLVNLLSWPTAGSTVEAVKSFSVAAQAQAAEAAANAVSMGGMGRSADDLVDNEAAATAMMVDAVAEVQVTKSKLGIELVEETALDRNKYLVVSAVKDKELLEMHPNLPGLMLTRIGGRSTIGVAPIETRRRLKGRPLTLSFTEPPK